VLTRPFATPEGKEMNAKHVVAVIAAGAAVLSAPCYAAAERDPCSLLTPAQVGAVLGTQVGEGKRLASLLCEWTDSTPGSRKKVDLTLISERGFEAAKTPVGGGLITKTPANGVGDDAVFGVTGKVASSLAVKKGGVMFAVGVQGFPLDQPQAISDVQAKEKTLALQIISKL
jgi:hypothetical protein